MIAPKDTRVDELDEAEERKLRRQYYDTIEELLKLVTPSALGAENLAKFEKIKDEHGWDGLSCYCGGGWLFGHRDGCPEAEPRRSTIGGEPVATQYRYWYSSGEPGVWLNERRKDADDLLESGVLIREETRALYLGDSEAGTESSLRNVQRSGAIRICPERDGRCPHGDGCTFAIDRYRCDIEGSRRALSTQREPRP